MENVFNEDISTEILLRLPLKSILRFKLVSKQWLSIVSSDLFRRIHSSETGILLKNDQSSSCHGLLHIDNDPQKISYYELNTNFGGGGKLTCKSSCNGLLLLKTSGTRSADFEYYICNPTTKECKALIDIPSNIRNNPFVSECLVFDPLKSPHYKVAFTFKSSTDKNKLELYVYSSMTGKTCKAIDVEEIGSYITVFYNGAIHWLSLCGTQIGYYDALSERLNMICVPLRNGIYYTSYIGECRDHLYIVTSKAEFDRRCLLDVHELKRDYSGWSLKYQVNLASIASEFPQLVAKVSKRKFYPCAILGIFCNEEEELSMVILGGDEWLSYNLKKEITRKLCKMPKPNRIYYSDHCWHNAYQFIPTLASV